MESPAVLLVHDEYGKGRGGISSINRQLAKILREHVPDIPVVCTALEATEEDKQDAHHDGIKLLLPELDRSEHGTPSLDWLTFDHRSKYPHLPANVRSIVGHTDITSRAAVRIKKGQYPDANVILFTNDIPEETEYYKGDEKALGIGKKEDSILEDAQEAHVVFSLGNKVFDHFENQFRGIPTDKLPQHFQFNPRPSKVFEDAKARYRDTVTTVVLSIGRVKSAEIQKGYDLAAKALSIVAEKRMVRWRIRGVDKDDFLSSKAILDENKSANLQATLLPLGSQEDICRDMMQAHLVLIPSRAEPFELIGLEAIAAGVPVLVSSRSGLADFIHDHVDELRHSIVVMDESEEAACVKHWAHNIEGMLKHNKAEFNTAARCKQHLLSTKYWAASHQQFIKACTGTGRGRQQSVKVQKRKRRTESVDGAHEGTKALKPDGPPPLLPIVVQIFAQVEPSVKTPKDLKRYAAAKEAMTIEITTVTDETLRLLKQIMPEIKSMEDLLDTLEAIKKLEKIEGVNVEDLKGGSLVFCLQCTDLGGLGIVWFMYKRGELDNLLHGSLVRKETLQRLRAEHVSVKATINVQDFRKALLYLLARPVAREPNCATSVDELMNLMPCSRQIGRSKLKGLDLAVVDNTVSPLNLTVSQVQTALRTSKEKSQQQLSQLKGRMQTARQDTEAMVLGLTRQVTMLTQRDEKAQKILIEHKKEIQQLLEANKASKAEIEGLTNENTKLANQVTNIPDLHDEIRTLRKKDEASQRALSEKNQEIQQLLQQSTRVMESKTDDTLSANHPVESKDQGEGLRSETRRSGPIDTMDVSDKTGKQDQSGAHVIENETWVGKAYGRIGILGTSGAGKSTFCNSFRGLRPKEPGAAAVGIVETTMEIEEYPHPVHKNVILMDFPGVLFQLLEGGSGWGRSLTFDTEKYTRKVAEKMQECDVFLIFTYGRIHSTAMWIAAKARATGKKVLFVRSHFDRDVEDMKRDDPEFFEVEQEGDYRLLQMARHDYINTLEQMGVGRVDKEDVFVISCLLDHIQGGHWDATALKDAILEHLILKQLRLTASPGNVCVLS